MIVLNWMGTSVTEEYALSNYCHVVCGLSVASFQIFHRSQKSRFTMKPPDVEVLATHYLKILCFVIVIIFVFVVVIVNPLVPQGEISAYNLGQV